MAVTIRAACRSPWLSPLDRREMERAMAVMMEALGVATVDVDLTLTDDGGMEEYNRQYLSCPGPTNILSFPGSPAAPNASASLVLNLDALARESLLYGQDSTGHLLRLLAHGLAHAAGHDHGPAMDAACALAEDRAKALFAG